MAQDLDAGPRVATPAFADRLAEAVERKRSQLVVGLDPRLDLLPVELRGESVLGRAEAATAYARFCCGLVDAVAPYVVAVKPQTAFFEMLGADGFGALERVCAYARAAGLLVIVDGEARRHRLDRTRLRGLVSRAARRRARARGRPHGQHLPRRRLESSRSSQACRLHGAGIFCLVRTSNPGADDVQELMLSDGRRVWQHVAGLVADWGAELVGERGLSSVGAVVGATVPRAVAEARRLLPRSVLLLPGVGAQGARPGDLARAFTSGPASALVSASRSVIYAYRSGGDDWRTAAGGEAARLRAEVWSVSGW